MTIILTRRYCEEVIKGRYFFTDPYREDCDCIGEKTKPCEGFEGSCDGGTSYCIGEITECFRIWHGNKSKEIIPCRE